MIKHYSNSQNYGFAVDNPLLNNDPRAHQGVWLYADHYNPYIPPKYRLITPWQPSQLQNSINHTNLRLKREDLTMLGSHKLRSMIYRFSLARYSQSHKKDHFVLSSSGNAAISAAYCATLYPKATLLIFISPKTTLAKKQLLSQISQGYPNIIIIKTLHPIRFASYFQQKENFISLRPSQDPWAWQGFSSLGYEIFDQEPLTQNIVSFVTSGASLWGIIKAGQNTNNNIKYWAVSSPDYEKNLGLKKVPQKIVDFFSTSRKGQIVEVKKKEILKSQTILKNNHQNVSWESAASFHVASTIANKEKNAKGITVCILTGTKHHSQTKDLTKDYFEEATTIQEVKKILEDRCLKKK